MNKQSAAETFDFTASFQRTLDRFESLAKSSRTDYERAMEKRAQRIAEHQESSGLELSQD